MCCYPWNRKELERIQGKQGFFLLLLLSPGSPLVRLFLVWTLVTIVLSPDDGAVHPFCSPHTVPEGRQNKLLYYKPHINRDGPQL